MMYILDTNVVSELRKKGTEKADRNVLQWAENTDASNLFISVITVMELELGILSVERKDAAQGAMLRRWFEYQVMPEFSNRILPVDVRVALRCAQLHVPNKCGERDAIIAATALVHGMTVVTRNVADFESSGVSIINPWNGQ